MTTIPIPRVALVAEDIRIARAIAELMGPGVFPLEPGNAIAGRRFDLIILYKWKPGDGASRILAELGEQWFIDSLQCRLARDGEIVYAQSLSN